MLKPGNIPIWIGIILIAGFFLMGQIYTPDDCDWLLGTDEAVTQCDVGVGTDTTRSTLDVGGEVGFQTGLVDSGDSCLESEWGIIRRCVDPTSGVRMICGCMEKFGADFQWRKMRD